MQYFCISLEAPIFENDGKILFPLRLDTEGLYVFEIFKKLEIMDLWIKKKR